MDSFNRILKQKYRNHEVIYAQSPIFTNLYYNYDFYKIKKLKRLKPPKFIKYAKEEI